eukprot:98935_1
MADSDDYVYEQVTINGKEYLKRHKVNDLLSKKEHPKKKSRISLDKEEGSEEDVQPRTKKKTKLSTKTEGSKGKGKGSKGKGKMMTVRKVKSRIQIEIDSLCEMSDPPLGLASLTSGNYKRFLRKLQETCQMVYFPNDEKTIKEGARKWLKGHWLKKNLPDNVALNQKSASLKQGFKSRMSEDRHVLVHGEMGWTQDSEVPLEADTLDWQFPAQVSYGRVAKCTPNGDHTEMELQLGDVVSKSAFKYIGIMVATANKKIPGSGQVPKKKYKLNPEMDKDFEMDCSISKFGLLDKKQTDLFESAMLTEWLPEFADEQPDLSDESDSSNSDSERVSAPPAVNDEGLVMEQHDPLKD